MVDRIASGPVTVSLAIRDHRTRRPGRSPSDDIEEPGEPAAETSQPALSDVVAAPPPPTEQREGFVAALLSGQLAPTPMSPEELALRAGSKWSPPSSELRLTDRRV
ncbi:MAG: hypothetical protein Q7T08_06500 [Devosia sp.]|nr:hypothetical protein [Devosia sp.]